MCNDRITTNQIVCNLIVLLTSSLSPAEARRGVTQYNYAPLILLLGWKIKFGMFLGISCFLSSPLGSLWKYWGRYVLDWRQSADWQGGTEWHLCFHHNVTCWPAAVYFPKDSKSMSTLERSQVGMLRLSAEICATSVLAWWVDSDLFRWGYFPPGDRLSPLSQPGLCSNSCKNGDFP